MKTGQPIATIREDNILSGKVKLITFQFSDGLLGFCLKEDDSLGFPITVVFSSEDEATEFHKRMIDNYINKNFPRNVKDIRATQAA